LVFVWAEEGSELKVDVPVVFKGEDVCPGLKKGNQRLLLVFLFLCFFFRLWLLGVLGLFLYHVM